MEILVLGINHKTAPVEIREKLSVPAKKTPEFLSHFKQKNIFEERLVLSTCNRTEIYGVSRDSKNAIHQTKVLLSEYSQIKIESFEDKMYILKQPESVSHLFSVASGLDSMVIGETEIIGQVKDAYLTAHENGQTGKVLNNLFQRSLKVAKNLRSETEIGSGRVSVASVAVDLARKIFDNLTNSTVFVLGTGEMGSQVAKAFVSNSAYPVIVSSHHFDTAHTLATSLGGKALNYEEYENSITDADILIASTHANRFVVRASQVKEWMKARHNKPLFIIDIAVPRNIDPEINKIDNVYLYNIDDLRQISDKNLMLRQKQLEKCAGLVRGQTDHFMNWLLKEFGVRKC